MSRTRPNYQALYDDMIQQRNTALDRVALLESDIVNYWQPENAAAIARAEAAEADVKMLQQSEGKLELRVMELLDERDALQETADEDSRFVDELIAALGYEIKGDMVFLSDLVAAVAALRARAEAAEAKLANQPQGYLAALDARDAAQLYLIKIMAALDMVVNDTTYDEVVEAVKALHARIAELEERFNRCKQYESQAQQRIAELEAAQGWRPVMEPPAISQNCQIVLNAQYEENGIIREPAFYVNLRPDGSGVLIRSVRVLKWRPAPPQE